MEQVPGPRNAYENDMISLFAGAACHPTRTIFRKGYAFTGFCMYREFLYSAISDNV